MRKLFSLALGALMSISAWCYENTAATFTWTVGNEAAATVVSDASDGVNETKVVLGAGLTVAGTKSNYAVNDGNTMVQYLPAESNKGVDPSVMIEFRVKMKKGVTFSLTGISYDAVKDGTDGASYSWSYAVDGAESSVTEVPAAQLLRNSGSNSSTAQLNHSHAVEAAAGQVVAFRIYVSGFANNKKFALSNIQLTGTINGEEEVRAFTDFKIEFRDNPYSVILPDGGELPTGVSVEGTTYNGGQHGVQGGTITVPVDGPVKFTIGTCQHSNGVITVKKDGVDYTTISNKDACGEQKPNYNQFVTWTYNVEEAAELTFEIGAWVYVPYFFGEACEFVPQVEVRYYDVDGKTLIGSDVVEGGSALAYAYGASDVTVAAGKAFRGWFNGSVPTATKVKEGITLTEDLNLYAKATEIEVTELGKVFDYDFRQAYFYPEDHEMLAISGSVSYNGSQHGLEFKNGSTLSIQVAGNALIAVDVCKYSNTSTTEVKDQSENIVGELSVVKNETTDGAKQTINYAGPATTLTFYFTATNYIHHVKVYNVAALPEKDENTGYYVLAPGDAAGLQLVLEALQDGDKIFLPNGTYDLGEACLTQISKNNVSIIGESMEGTIIKNTPDFHKEGISTTATFLVTGTNTYLQDLTLWNNMDYFAALAATNNGRAVCLQDKGTQTICKNVRMLSNQDTYYSNKVGGLKYFEDCEIHGTVDFICGDGSVYFKNNVLVGEQRSATGGGANAITASNADANDKGYVFDSCRVMYSENIQGALPVMSLGRSWNNAPKCVFLNTTLDDSNGTLVMTKNASSQKDKISRWHLGAMNALPEKVGEFNSMDNAGNIVSPSSNNVTFVLGTDEKPMETILMASEAATYTMDYTLGTWATTAKADATQAVCEQQWADLEADAIYLAECEGEFVMLLKGSEVMTNLAIYDGKTYILRKANARGGFGAPANQEETTAVENTADESVKVTKEIRNGQLFILRDGKEYNVLGTEIR